MEIEQPIIDAARHWIIRLASGEMSAAERQQFAEWLGSDPQHAAAFEAEDRLWRLAGALEPTVLAGTSADAGTRGRAGLRRSPLARAAAAILAITALAAFVFADDLMVMAQADVRTSAGHQKRYELPDGSIALLNTASALAVDYSPRERRVRLLKGEAFFEVRPRADLPFRVEAGESTAEAVGTAFAVRRTSGKTAVTVSEGKVSVSLRQNEPAPVVEANRKLEVEAGARSAKPQKVDAEKALAWRSGKIVFEAAPFSDAVAELDRYFPGRIVVAARLGKTSPVTGVIHSGQLVAGIRAIAEVEGLAVTEAPGGLLLILH